MAKASVKKKSVVKKAVAKKKPATYKKASTDKVLAFSYVEKAQMNLDKALARQNTLTKKVVEARKKVTEARKKLANKRSAAGERALTRARIAVGKATEALLHAKSVVKLAKLKLVEANTEAMVKRAQDEAAERLALAKDELAARAEADLLIAQDAFIASWSRTRASTDAKKLKKEAKLLAKKVAKVVNKAKAKLAVASRKAEAKVSRKRRARTTK